MNFTSGMTAVLNRRKFSVVWAVWLVGSASCREPDLAFGLISRDNEKYGPNDSTVLHSAIDLMQMLPKLSKT